MAYQQPPGYTPYAQQPQGGAYPPQQGQGYPPPQQGYQPAPTYGQQQQSNTNVVVVAQQPTQVRTTYVERDSTNHLLHFIICLFCPWWIFVWMIVCCINGC